MAKREGGVASHGGRETTLATSTWVLWPMTHQKNDQGSKGEKKETVAGVHVVGVHLSYLVHGVGMHAAQLRSVHALRGWVVRLRKTEANQCTRSQMRNLVSTLVLYGSK